MKIKGFHFSYFLRSLEVGIQTPEQNTFCLLYIILMNICMYIHQNYSSEIRVLLF